jgi:cardiolipin synthase
VKVQGPVVQCVQVSWIEDWNWATSSRPVLNWKPEPAPGGEDGLAFCLPSGPADEFETCTLFFLHAIQQRRSASGSQAPTSCLTSNSSQRFNSPRCAEWTCASCARQPRPRARVSLQLYLSPGAGKSGVQTWRYHAGFLHEKAILVDDVCGIGTANFDNRSFRLNFEITLLFSEPLLVRDAETMFVADFARSTRATAADFTARPWWFRLSARTRA